ncbi:extensin family protein [Pseudomonas sp. R2.Fl]|nr:extensin family protein [Pseudomonas sp. R2.Fl]
MLKRLALAAALLALPAFAAPDTLPERPPVPLPKPVEAEPSGPAAVPVPAEKPDEAPKPPEKPAERQPAGKTPPGQPGEGTPATDSSKAAPPAGEAAEEPAGETQGPPKPKEPAPPPPPPVEKEDEQAYRACLGELRRLGAEFRPLPRIDDGDGCGIDRPIGTTRLSAEVTIEPEVVTRCETALQLARMTRDFVEPAARLGLPDLGRLKTVHQASGYVCRKRNGAATGKISEHARGNAIDIAALEFDKEPVPMRIVEQEDSDLASAFQRALNAFACLYFTTVLSPGSDSAHEDHMHLDVMGRRGGYRYCR